MMFLLLILWLGLFFCAFMMIRTQQVYKAQMEWLDVLHRRNIGKIKQHELDDLYDYDEVLPAFSDMMKEFWKPINEFKPIRVDMAENDLKQELRDKLGG